MGEDRSRTPGHEAPDDVQMTARRSMVQRRRNTDGPLVTSRRTTNTEINSRLLRLALAGAAALAAIAPASASASGGLLGGTLRAVTGVVGSATTACDANAATAKTFAPWLDQANYKAARSGDFEAGSPNGTLTGGAKVVAGNAKQKVGGAGDRQSLELPPGASATSPASCVGLAEPTVRMFASGPITGIVLTQAVYGGIPIPGGVITGGDWAPSLPMLTGLGLVGKSFSIRVTNIGLGTMRVDDVYIDPYRRG